MPRLQSRRQFPGGFDAREDGRLARTLPKPAKAGNVEMKSGRNPDTKYPHGETNRGRIPRGKPPILKMVVQGVVR